MADEKKWQLDLNEYIRQGEPEQAEKSEAWQIAIGLQQVDGLQTSNYLLDTAKEHIEGKINIKEVQRRIHAYYEEQAVRHDVEADTVIYAPYNSIRDTLAYDFQTEKQFSYEGLSLGEAILHLAKFTSDIWQIHPFCEGNTRATAVFMIKYLKTFGMNVDNEAFKSHSWYFRNALVRANYNNLKNGIYATTKFLELFFSNLLLGTDYDLKNRYMHVDYMSEQADTEAQSVIFKGSKVQNDTLKCTLEEIAVLKLMIENPSVTQKELLNKTGKSLSTVKRIVAGKGICSACEWQEVWQMGSVGKDRVGYALYYKFLKRMSCY